LIEVADGHFHNSFVLATPAGEVAGAVRKSCPAWIEARWFKGRPGPHVIDTALGRIGVSICHEN
jgi:predicted amidohydrolase